MAGGFIAGITSDLRQMQAERGGKEHYDPRMVVPALGQERRFINMYTMHKTVF